MEVAQILGEIVAENPQLSAQLLSVQTRLSQLEQEKETLQEEKIEAGLRIEVLESENDHLKRMLFGQKRERFVSSLDPAQLSLALGLEEKGEEIEEGSEESISYIRKKPAKKKTKPTGRKPWPAHLKRVEIQLLPEGDMEGMKQIGEHRTEELDFIPLKPFVRVFIRPIYAEHKADPITQKTRVVCAELPARIIPKSSVGPGLLAMVMCDKFLDHLPIYRQVGRYRRLGIEIARSTMDNWLRLVAQQLEPLGEALKAEVFQADYLQADETRIQVLEKTHNQPKASKKEPPGKTHRGYFWPYYSPLEKLCYFQYCHGRAKTYPKEALKDFQGYLQTDGYAAYDQFGTSKTITLVGCLAHVRRKFFEARPNDLVLANQALDLIKELYAIEAQARKDQMSFAQRLELRTQQAQGIWESFSTWLDQQMPFVLPKSDIGKAISYAINRRSYIARYLEEGKIEIDNNLIENQIRPIALGRKNYLFAGSEKGAHRAALFYSLLASCKQQEIEPFTWLHEVLLSLPTHPINQIDQLLPHKWKPNPDIPPALRQTP